MILPLNSCYNSRGLGLYNSRGVALMLRNQWGFSQALSVLLAQTKLCGEPTPSLPHIHTQMLFC